MWNQCHGLGSGNEQAYKCICFVCEAKALNVPNDPTLWLRLIQTPSRFIFKSTLWFSPHKRDPK